MPGSFVSDLIKAALIDLVFKRPIQLQFGRGADGKIDFRANINPSSGGNQQPVVLMAQPQGYGYPGAYPPPYPPQFHPAFQVQQFPQGASGAPSPTTTEKEKPSTDFDLLLPSSFRR